MPCWKRFAWPTGKTIPSLLQIYVLFRELGADLETHMTKEEHVLFPYVIRMEAAAKQHVPLFRPPFGTVANPVRMMMLEHDRAGELLKKIRALSSNYVPPADGCLSYQTLYAAFADAGERSASTHSSGEQHSVSESNGNGTDS